ncbi:hypothetical protein GXW82_22590 [Streptacidiphilus sp. 4-A2]|nr:hypothetical protein [Streptacidiphilus sp. 4-A2]
MLLAWPAAALLVLVALTGLLTPKPPAAELQWGRPTPAKDAPEAAEDAPEAR